MDVPLLREGKPVSRTEIARKSQKHVARTACFLIFYEDVNLSPYRCDFDCLFLFL